MKDWPEKFLTEIREIIGDEYDAFLEAMEREPLSALRINPLRENAKEASAEFFRDMPSGVLWESLGYYAAAEKRPGASLLHAAGAFYMQDASAMSPVAVLKPEPGDRVLDLCAAPGGKSGQIAAYLSGEGFLLSNEIELTRAKILASNLERLGISNVCVTSADSSALSKALPEFFNKVLVDAPCSGEGMFRKDADAVSEWSEGSPAGCAERQAGILDNAAKMLRPGGKMVYSTCTFNRTENENTVNAFLERHPEFEKEEFSLAGVGESVNGCIRLWPHKIEGEGHFAALLVKKDGGKSAKISAPNEDKNALAALAQFKKEAIASLPDGVFQMEGEFLTLVPEKAPARESLFVKGVRVLRYGLPLCRVGKGFVQPEHSCAMALSPDAALRSAELTPSQAADYMAGEELSLSAPKGWTLMTYKRMPLGWGKASGDKIKNHLPKGLRKRGGHFSDV